MQQATLHEGLAFQHALATQAHKMLTVHQGDTLLHLL